MHLSLNVNTNCVYLKAFSTRSNCLPLPESSRKALSNHQLLWGSDWKIPVNFFQVHKKALYLAKRNLLLQILIWKQRFLWTQIFIWCLVFSCFLTREGLYHLCSLLLPVTFVFQPKSYTKHTNKTYTKTNTTIWA